MEEFILISLLLSAVKLLFIPLYHSTDFEVHRNWLALTYSLPVDQWYYERTSPWTLDYPPLFAWFEYGLAQIAQFVDTKMLQVSNLDHASKATVAFQRISVICTDLVYAYAIYRLCAVMRKTTKFSQSDGNAKCRTLSILLLTNIGLIIVDHIHFQYNGFLFGVWLMSIVSIFEKKPYHAAFWFSVLLNLKHIYLYVAPVYFIYLFRSHCVRGQSFSLSRINLRSLSLLGAVVMAVFSLSFGPFLLKGQRQQIMSRLFPFKRGLCHAYWAPNFWVFYNCLDKAAFFIGRRMSLLPSSVNATVGVMTGGLVQEFDHQVLPSVFPRHTMLLVILSILPTLYMLWHRPGSPEMFLRGVITCALGSFLFGWHVHEKAILLVLIPFTIVAVFDANDAEIFKVLSVAGHFSLLPLVFTATETPLKYLLVGLYLSFLFYSLSHLHSKYSSPPDYSFVSLAETVYIWMSVPLEVFCLIGYEAFGLGHLEFLPLLLTSLYSAIGVIYSAVRFQLYCWERFQEGSIRND